MDPLTPISAEIASHHAAQHVCLDPPRPVEGDRLCPHGTCAAILCSRCGEILYAAVKPNAPACKHLRQLTSGRRVSGTWTAVNRAELLGWGQ